LTLRTFHTGGVAGETDITTGLPRIQELFEGRNPKGESIISSIDGALEIIDQDDGSRALKISSTRMRRKPYRIPADWQILVEDGQEIAPKTPIAVSNDPESPSELISERGGRVHTRGLQIIISWEQHDEVLLPIESGSRLRVKNGDQVVAGQQLTEGSINPHRLLEVMGREAVQKYLVDEVQKVYRSQGVPIHDKHVEIVVRQMTNRVRVVHSRDGAHLPGEVVDRRVLNNENNDLREVGKHPAVARPILLGITKAALATDSFLSASSFQHTINVLAQAAIEGKEDNLVGLKENVIIGKLIPAGTGYGHYHDMSRYEDHGDEDEARELFKELNDTRESSLTVEEEETDPIFLEAIDLLR
jgi:DNA-directed RNA polymerase subunit beta'